MTNKQEVLKELLVEAGWVSAQHVDKVMLIFDVGAKSATTSVVPPPVSVGSSNYRTYNTDPAVVTCMNVIRDWVRVNHRYKGNSTDLSKMLKEVGIKIDAKLARQIVSESGLEWPSGYNWDRYRFYPRGHGGKPRDSRLLTDEPAIIEAYSLLIDHLGVSSKQETYYLSTEEVRAIIEIPAIADWSKGQGFRRKKNVPVNSYAQESIGTLEKDTWDSRNLLDEITSEENGE